MLAISPAQNTTAILSQRICPYSASGFADGCSGYVPGLPQNPTLLLPYGANRPPWNVAGVDYRVGHSGALKDPSAAGTLPACATYSAGSENDVTINSAPCTIDHFDFSLNTGVCLIISSSITNNLNVTITNNNFVIGTTCHPPGGGMIAFLGNVTSFIRYNTFNEKYGNAFSNIINQQVDGSTTIEYNVFLNADQAGIGLQGSGTYVVRFNYMFGLGCCTSHADWFILNNGSGKTFSIDEEFNTIVRDPVNQFTAGGGAGAFCYISLNPGVNFTSGKCANDTYISPLNYDGTTSVTYPVRVEPAGTVGLITISNNYIDYSGSFGAIQSRSTLGTATVACSGNQNLTTGVRITTVVVVGSSFMTCN